jgi:hypothetical protein
MRRPQSPCESCRGSSTTFVSPLLDPSKTRQHLKNLIACLGTPDTLITNASAYTHVPPTVQSNPFLLNSYVKMGIFCLTSPGKIGYYIIMFGRIALFVLRISLVATLWTFIWRFVEPRTQHMRILRAALLVLGLLVILAVLRLAGQ